MAQSWTDLVTVEVKLARDNVIPNGYLNGQVIVTVKKINSLYSCLIGESKEMIERGLRYRRLQLQLVGYEHNTVRDDLGEFDDLLEGYTSKRTYLNRHVTLAGTKKTSEEYETEMQVRQETMFKKHRTIPYSRLVPPRPAELNGPPREKKAGPAGEEAAQVPVSISSGTSDAPEGLNAHQGYLAHAQANPVQQQQVREVKDLKVEGGVEFSEDAKLEGKDTMTAIRRHQDGKDATEHPSNEEHNATHIAHSNEGKDNKSAAHTKRTINSGSRIKARPANHEKTPIMPTLADIAFSPTGARHNEDWDDVLAADPADIALELDDTSHSQPTAHSHSVNEVHVLNEQEGLNAVQYVQLNDNNNNVLEEPTNNDNGEPNVAQIHTVQQTTSPLISCSAPLEPECNANNIITTTITNDANNNDIVNEDNNYNQGNNIYVNTPLPISIDNNNIVSSNSSTNTTQNNNTNNNCNGTEVETNESWQPLIQESEYNYADCSNGINTMCINVIDNNNNINNAITFDQINEEVQNALPCGSSEPPPPSLLLSTQPHCKKHTHHTKHKECCHFICKHLLKCKNECHPSPPLKDHWLKPGRYVFPFSFRIPPWLPPSFYYKIDDAHGLMEYSAIALLEFDDPEDNIKMTKHFYILSTISRRQIMAAQEEVVRSITVAPIPPLTALFQVFSCSCMGNLCCLFSHSFIEVEVLFQSSRGVVLRDTKAVFEVFRQRYLSLLKTETSAGVIDKTGVLLGNPLTSHLHIPKSESNEHKHEHHVTKGKRRKHMSAMDLLLFGKLPSSQTDSTSTQQLTNTTLHSHSSSEDGPMNKDSDDLPLLKFTDLLPPIVSGYDVFAERCSNIPNYLQYGKDTFENDLSDGHDVTGLHNYKKMLSDKKTNVERERGESSAHYDHDEDNNEDKSSSVSNSKSDGVIEDLGRYNLHHTDIHIDNNNTNSINNNSINIVSASSTTLRRSTAPYLQPLTHQELHTRRNMEAGHATEMNEMSARAQIAREAEKVRRMKERQQQQRKEKLEKEMAEMQADEQIREQRRQETIALLLLRAQAEASLPIPLGIINLLIRVANKCTSKTIDTVRVELRETVQVFKSLERPRVFKEPLARYDYTTPICPGAEATFIATLRLPNRFRRCKEDAETLLPPTGVRTASIFTSTALVITFPGIATYIEEEDWATGLVQLAEMVDLHDEVLDLPVRYS